MTEFTHPSEIARETLRRLAIRKTPPTPDNYSALYQEISGIPATEIFPERAFRALATALPRATSEQARFARQFETAVTSGNWEAVRTSLTDFMIKAGDPPSWAALIRELVQQLATHHMGLTTAKKRESIEHVLATAGAPDLLFARLQSILRSWTQNPIAESSDLVDGDNDTADTNLPPADTVADSKADQPVVWSGGIGDLKELIAQLLENTLPIILADSPDLVQEARAIASAARIAQGATELGGLAERLKKLAYRAHFIAEDQAEMKTALLHLVRLIIENVSELVVDDDWLVGQITVVRDLVQQPLNLRRLDDVERRMKDVIIKQGSLKQSLNEARDRLKLMLATFVDRLADFSESTSGYHDKIEYCAERISQAKDISELSDVLDEVMRETRVIQLNAARSRDELSLMRTRVEESDKEVTRLQTELTQASQMVRHDPLTGALNRRGLDEVLVAELARARRHGGALSVAMLDIDNFKKLNDSLGHAAGDAALVHLSSVVKKTIRPQDTLARYGGEEFVVLLPSTPLDDAVTAMVRVQRELTRQFFLHNNDKVLITFSCGVAEMMKEEDPQNTLSRADEAMYLAKRAGKNRVVPA